MQDKTLTIPDTSLIWISRKKKGQGCSRERGNSGSGDYGSTEWCSKDKECPLWPRLEIALAGAEPSKRNNYSANQVAFELRNQPWNEIIRKKHRQIQWLHSVIWGVFRYDQSTVDPMGALTDLRFSCFIRADKSTPWPFFRPQKQVLKTCGQWCKVNTG